VPAHLVVRRVNDKAVGGHLHQDRTDAMMFILRVGDGGQGHQFGEAGTRIRDETL
jgi:hypothetical protein